MTRNKQPALTRDAILQANDLKTKTVTVKEWGGIVIVREMTAADREEFENRYFDPESKNMAAWLLVRTVVDEKGDRLFADEDIEALAGKGSTAIMRAYDAASELNGLSAKAKKDLEKN